MSYCLVMFILQLTDNVDCLRDVHIAGKKLFLVQGDVPQLLDWDEYGLRINVSEKSLSSSDTAEVAIVAVIGGQFLFPHNTKLVSAVYAVSISKPLLRPLRLDVQHCVDLTRSSQTKYLKFAIAPVNTRGLPYQFSLVEGGEFTVGSRYGSIYRQSFSLVSEVMVTGDGECNGGTGEEDEHSNGEEEDQPQPHPGSGSREEEEEEDEEEDPGSDSSDSVKTKDTSLSKEQGQLQYHVLLIYTGDRYQ